MGSDRSLALERELAAKTEEMNKENLFYAGAHASALALIKESALHEYRDQERQARRDVAVAQERENWVHAFWRRRRKRAFPALTAPERAEPLLDHWRSSVTRHGSSPIEVVDPKQRNLGAVTQEAQNSPKKFV